MAPDGEEHCTPVVVEDKASVHGCRRIHHVLVDRLVDADPAGRMVLYAAADCNPVVHNRVAEEDKGSVSEEDMGIQSIGREEVDCIHPVGVVGVDYSRLEEEGRRNRPADSNLDPTCCS